MPEYLSPGVYIEEYESGTRSVSGVSTSVPGFIGLAQRGPLKGPPQLVTGITDYQRKYGGYLPRAYGEFRYLAYAVEHFFANGGSRCYVMRVKLEGCEKASGVVFFARNFAGMRVKAKTGISKDFNLIFTPTNSAGADLLCDTTTSYLSCTLTLAKGDRVLIRESDPSARPPAEAVLTVESTDNDTIKFTSVPNNIQALISDSKTKIFVSDFNMTVDGKVFSNLSMNPNSANFVTSVCGGTDEIPVDITLEEDGYFTKLFEWITAGKSCPMDIYSGEPYICVFAKDEGVWGNDIRLIFETEYQVKQYVTCEGGGSYTVGNSSYFSPGDIAAFSTDGTSSAGYQFKVVRGVDGKTLRFDSDFSASEGENKGGSIFTTSMRITVAHGNTEEVYEGVTLNPNSPDYICKRLGVSELVYAETGDAVPTDIPVQPIAHPFTMLFPNAAEEKCSLTLSGGSDGDISKINPKDLFVPFKGDGTEPGEKTGLEAFRDNDTVSLLCAPGVTDKNIQSILVNQCDTLGSRMAVLDVPATCKSVEKILEHRQNIESSYAAMYHPWLIAYDPLDKVSAAFPPSGAVLGVYSRSDQQRGVHKAPANEVVSGIQGLHCVYNSAEQAALNPKGVNLIMPFTGQGIRVWGARTCSSNSLWKYVNVRRLFIYVEESIRASTNWIVFEPNDRLLWLRVKLMISDFLNEVWRSGGLAGTSEKEAFFVDVGESTMTQRDIDEGRLICKIGIAPVKPAEFVIFRITQKTLD